MTKIRSFARWSALLLMTTLACEAGVESPTGARSVASLSTNGVDVTMAVDSWGGGYCANLTLANTSTSPVTSWTLVVALGQSTLNNIWGGTAAVSGGQLTIRPVDYTANIAPNASVTLGFCGTGSSTPTLVSLAVVGGGAGTTSYTLGVSKTGTGSGTVTSTPAGISCGATCGATYASGTTVTLTAAAGSGATFGGWSGACVGTSATCTASMTAARSVTATFTASPGGTCDAGTTTTQWATSCPTAPASSCVSGTWVDPGSTTGDPAQCQSTHFVVHAPAGTITATQCQAAISYLETVVWPAYFGSPIFFPEPYCGSTTKYKASVHIRSEFALTGGGWGSGYMGMWVGPGATSDHWGLAHEFMHALQSTTRGLDCARGGNYCGWIHESHANFMPHQLPEFANNVHCSEMLANAPHLYLGSTRDRYCNWQFMEYLKDRHCYRAVNDLWTAPTTSNDPFTNLRTTRGWTVSQLNDFFGEWAMHNVTWDYKSSGGAFRATYGAITDRSRPERRLRVTQLEPLDGSWASNRRFAVPYLWAPQRWGYNVVRLHPEAGATRVTVTFRGVVQTAASSDWRWGLVATSATLTNPRYSALQRGSDGQLTFCVNAGESLWLVVMGTPSVQQQIVWDQAYPSIYRFPYMVQLAGAWPEGFQGGVRAPCPAGLVRVANGGGCGPSSLPSSVYVGPFAQVVGGTVSGTARIEDHATVVSGTVSGGTVGGLTIVNRFTVSPSARAQTTFYPLGFFESGQGISGSAWLYGDVEYRGANYNRGSGSCSGYVDSATCIPGTISDVNVRPPYAWR